MIPVVEISKELYDKLNKLGLIPNDVRKDNIGNSNYSKHTIQPWSIWLDYDLNAWDADIVKRVLRTKEEPGISKEEARLMDYNKIIHICEERKRQLLNQVEHTPSLVEIPRAVLAENSDNKLPVSYLIGSEIYHYQEFLNKHRYCGGLIQTTMKGTEQYRIVTVQCPICGQEEDITDPFIYS